MADWYDGALRMPDGQTTEGLEVGDVIKIAGQSVMYPYDQCEWVVTKIAPRRIDIRIKGAPPVEPAT